MRFRALPWAPLALALACFGCKETVGPDPTPNDPPPNDPGDVVPVGKFFAEPLWHDGGRYSPKPTPPNWQIEIEDDDDEDDDEVDVPQRHCNPSYAPVVPRDADDIRYSARAKAVLTEEHIQEVVDTLNSGLPTAEGDLVVFPSVSMFTPPGEEYYFFHINLQGQLEGIPTRDGELRTRVVGIAFGNGQGGYVAQAPDTEDTFAGALVWMKSTRNPSRNNWSMDQRDWRYGGAIYGTSLRLLIRGDAAVAVIRKSELDDLGVTQFRWDTFSYTTNTSTEWSHDFTEWTPIE